LRYADSIARRANARLMVLYINDPLLTAAAAAALHDRHFPERGRHELQEFVDATLGSHARIQTCLGNGHPPNEILRIAGEANADLLVLGTQGLTGADRMLIGSTTLGVLRRTSMPVLAVPSPDDKSATVPSPSWPGPRIMAAVELDRATRLDVITAAEVARWLDASMLFVNVVKGVSAPARLMPDHDRIRIAQAQQKLDRLVRAAKTDVRVETRVVWGRPADEIAAAAATEQVGLLVTTLRDRRGWFGARRGSVSYHVLSHAAVPVLAYPPQWRPR
jgi:nucleotide-binding universal stress UspA family protein